MVRHIRLICLALFITCCVVPWTLPAAAEDAVLMMATTTSTDNTGLLDYLAPHFKKATGIDLRWTAPVPARL
jgi:tungstate transport system substrate-binding protein